MAIPPFPSKDMAKLVLGYLMEEQLMTAYDEFLNESPYLDALRNEYDRILMNSLRNILAEYRAVKIYVETCKPVALRRRLFQCSNLLEVVKFLVQHIDATKLQDTSRDRIGYDSEKVTTSRTGCDVCHSLKLESCVCPTKKRNLSSSKCINNSDSIEAGRNPLQTTSLSELPGNQVPENTSIQHQIHQPRVINQQEVPLNGYHVPSIANIAHNSINIPSLQIQSNPLITSTQKQVCGNATTLQCSQNIAEFNTVLNQVYSNSSVTGTQRNNNAVCTQYGSNNATPIAGSFQDFSTGVKGAVNSNVNIPDSSTTEKINVSCSERNNKNQCRTEKVQQRKKCVFRIGNVKHDVTEICSEVIDVDSDDVPQNLPSYQQPEDPKVTILSDVRVGNDDRLNALPKNATSTPLLHMQTIYINNTPVYKPKPLEHKFTFTRDEIMAMPTIILVPASGPSNTVASSCEPPKTTFAPSSNVASSTCHIPPTLPPLTVDVSNSSPNVEGNLPNLQNTHEVNVQDTFSKPGLVKTVEVLKNASVPKDNIVSGSSSTSTPHIVPPQRKSSSTPRRTSHVRVLDFTTPRRILNETIIENPTDDTDLEKPVEVMISKSPNVTLSHGSVGVDNTGHSITAREPDQTINTVSNASDVSKSTKNIKIKHKKTDWDADLRALVGAAERTEDRVCKSKPKRKHVKKTTEEKETDNNKTSEKSAEKIRKKSSKTSASCNNKHPKKIQKSIQTNLETVEKTEEKVPSPTVSPTGIFSAPNKETARELEKVQNKSNDEENIDTPEVERLSLRNEIGAKLNISDILETPYKQALYEIQMETPRFLGPELPDDPMSDIKITDIPTPRFLSSNMPYTPKPVQPTPSSYSSRPTDYSSGGSYYKPDDQDYLPNLDAGTCPVTSSHSKDNPKKSITEGKSGTAVKEHQSRDRPKRNRSRPVRQCTKNVSYYNSPMINKNTDENKKEDVSSCSDTISANSSLDDIQKDNMTTPRTDTKKIITIKSGKKSLSLAKKRSPLKKSAQKPFMKIKPRRTTPSKDSGRKNKKSLELSQVSSKGKSRARNTKDNVSSDSCLVPAPTKSRRKSSTPRKLHCTKTFNSESSGHESPETQTKEKSQGEINTSNAACVQDSDTEQLPLRWSDDGSQDTRIQCETESVENETEDVISKIKEYIDNTIPPALAEEHNCEGTIRSHLVKRGFDRETAEKIERDLLLSPAPVDEQSNFQSNAYEIKNDRSIESDCSALANNLVINEEDSDDLEFTVHECNEDSTNYIFVRNDESKHPSKNEIPKLKDKFSMEVCIDEGVVVRLRATSLHNLFDLDTQDSGRIHETNKETEMAVSSISNMDRLYTPMKDPVRAQCYEIFDSTLTSIDTPLKADSPVRKLNSTVAEIIIEEDDVEVDLEMKEKAENRKRKRLHCNSTSDEPVSNENKKVKPETQFMIQTKDIKDIDIEVLLTKLHGS